MNKEFYFIRHGQTDHNLLEGPHKGDHPHDIPLNPTGRAQAKYIIPIISSLSIRTVCSSPFKRAQETKEILNLPATHHEIPELGEGTSQIWKAMSQHGMYSPLPPSGPARQFIDRVHTGLAQALSHPGPLLIVAHGGVHWAICCLLQIQNHEWAIGNCIPVHFFLKTPNKWTAKKLEC